VIDLHCSSRRLLGCLSFQSCGLLDLAPVTASVTATLETLHGCKSVAVEHLLVLVPAVALGGQHLFTSKDCICASGEAQDLFGFAHCRAASGNADDSCRHDDAGSGYRAEDGVEADTLAVAEWSALDGDQSVDGERFGVFRERSHGVEQTDMVLWLLAQTENAAGANVDASGANVLECCKALIVAASRDDRRVVLSACVEVVVVCGQTSAFQLVGLTLVDHSKCDASLHVHRYDALNHCSDVLQARLATSHVTPSGTHAEPCASIALCDPGSFEDGVDGGHLGCFEALMVC
jgi:hypothetical protein